jgi:hypothetical protein
MCRLLVTSRYFLDPYALYKRTDVWSIEASNGLVLEPAHAEKQHAQEPGDLSERAGRKISDLDTRKVGLVWSWIV